MTKYRPTTPRRVIRARERAQERGEAARAVDALVGVKKPARGRSGGPSALRVRQLGAEVRAMVSVKRWDGAKPAHLVALYAVLHEMVYDVDPAELVGATFLAAQSAAGKLLRDEFDGDVEAAVDFVRWTWRREKRDEKRRLDEGREGRRIGWRLQFQERYLMTDYRRDLARRRKQ